MDFTRLLSYARSHRPLSRVSNTESHRIPAQILLLKFFLLCAIAFGTQSIQAATIYSNGDADNVPFWKIGSQKYQTSGSVSSVFDSALQSNVIETRTNNGLYRTYFQLGSNRQRQGWNNNSEFHASWKMASESFVVIIYLDTSKGWRKLRYTKRHKGKLLSRNGRTIRYGLGDEVSDGNWHSISRDLQADIAKAEPDNTLVGVRGFRVRGNMRLDDIALSSNLDSAPKIEIAAYEPQVSLGDTLILDASTSYDPDGQIVAYSLINETGNEVCSEPVCTVEAQELGDQLYTFIVTDNSGLSAEKNISFTVIPTTPEPDPEPVASFTAVVVEASLRVELNASSSSDDDKIVLYQWDFGNGETGTGIATSVIYKTGGEKTISLTVTDTAQQSNTMVQTIEIDMPATPPVAAFSASPLSDETPLSLAFDARQSTATSPATIVSYSWDFGDDSIGTGPSTQHTYAEAGEYTVSLTILDSNKLESTASKTVKVEAPDPEPDPPPRASFTAVVVADTLRVELNASASADNDQIVSYTWDFGNSETAMGVATSVIYKTPGKKTISLTVTDTANQSDTIVQTIDLDSPSTPPVAVFTNTQLGDDNPLTLAFDASQSTATAPAIVSGYTWDFGDQSTGTGAAIEHTFREAGEYEVTLTVTDSNESKSITTETVTVLAPEADPEPVASFSSNAGSGVDSLTIALDASASSDNAPIVSYDWDFGNGETGAGIQVSVTYATPGEKLISLTVTDSANQTNTLERTIVVTDDGPATPPEVSFTATILSPEETLTLFFDASASSAVAPAEIDSYAWDFGDDSSGTSVIAEHTYQLAGEYAVTLTVTDTDNQTSTATETITVVAPDPEPPTSASAADAARLLTQASFGPTMSSIAAVQNMGIENWIDDQLEQLGPAHLNYVNQYATNGSDRFARHNIWWLDAVNGSDQLRQRVAFALSQIMVISDSNYALGNSQYGVTRYYDILRENAFGSFRELLEDVTLSPVMGLYLSSLQNAKADLTNKTISDENYAREVMQLFTIGPHELNPDGTTKTQLGLPVPSFDQTDVEEFARVFTGWNYKDASRWNEQLGNAPNVVDPMEAFEEYHDKGEKVVFSNQVIAAGQSARQDLERALDILHNHRNTGPFIAKQLIQKLVTSNPSPAYVARVTAVFNDNGQGVRGDLGAVVRALLLDTEARSGHISLPGRFGKLREPLLRLSHLWRAFNIQPGSQSMQGEYNTNSPHVEALSSVTGQAVLKANSVFNFFSPKYAPLGSVQDAGLVAPEAALYIDNLITTTTNRINTQIQRFYTSTPFESDLSRSTLNFATENELAVNPAALLDHLDILLLSGTMSDGLRSALLEHITAFPDTVEGRSIRVRDSVSLIMASPEYLVQR